MALENVMRVDNGNIVTGGGAGGNSVEIDWEDWCELTPEEQETGDWTIVNCPWADGDVSVDLMTKLWENPNPTASFAEKDIILSSDDWDILIIVNKISPSNSTWEATFIVTKHSISNNRVYYVESFTSNGGTFYSRGFNIVSKTTLHFLDSYIGNGGTRTLDNTVNIPYQIFGLKTTATVKINAIAMDVSTSADKCMMSDGETSVEERLDANTFGTEVILTNYTGANPYIAPCDGYVVGNTSDVGQVVQGFVNGILLIHAYSQTGNRYQRDNAYVKKGMSIYALITNGGALRFYPLQ